MYWDPFDELDRMHKEMDRMFGRFLGRYDKPMIGHIGHKHEITPYKGFRTPLCNMQETESKIIATFELPGVDKADIDLVVDDDHLELSVESKVEKKEKQKQGYHYTAHRQSFYRKVPLPKIVESDKAEAEYKNGILRVEIPKKYKDKKKKRKINVK